MNDKPEIKFIHFLDTDDGFVAIDPETATANELALVAAVKYWQDIAEKRRNPFWRWLGDPK